MKCKHLACKKISGTTWIFKDMSCLNWEELFWHCWPMWTSFTDVGISVKCQISQMLGIVSPLVITPWKRRLTSSLRIWGSHNSSKQLSLLAQPGLGGEVWCRSPEGLLEIAAIHPLASLGLRMLMGTDVFAGLWIDSRCSPEVVLFSSSSWPVESCMSSQVLYSLIC